MDKQLQLLILISENEDCSQRYLAKALDVSLGTVNGMISQMIQLDYLFMDTINPKQSKYFLTDKGRLFKTEKLKLHVIDSYHTIGQTRKYFGELISQKHEEGVQNFYLYGEEDVIYKLMKMSLIEFHRFHKISYTRLQDLEDFHTGEDSCLIYWDSSLHFDPEVNAIMI